MSTPHSTLVSEILAEYNARPEANAGPSTPKNAHARMIQLVNAANGLRYELARFGDIERQLKAIHEKMEPLVLKAKELNDLVCERVSQASQPWADSRIHESEELLQKVQQLERENAALREKAERYRLVTLRQDADNTALCNKLAALENQTQWECSCGGTDCEGIKENAELRSLVQHWYKLVPQNIRSSIEDAQKEAKP